jgi:MFS family permease
VWSLPILLFASYAVAFMDRALVAVAAAPIKQDLGLSDLQYGLLSGTAFAALYCLCGLPFGWLADRVDRRAMIAVGLLVWSAMTALCGLARSYEELLLARIGVGLGEATLLPAGMSWLRDRMRAEQMGRAVAIFLMGSAAGAIIANVVGGAFLVHFARSGGPVAPWRALFLLAGLPGVVVAIAVWAMPAPARSSVAEVTRNQVRAVARHLWERRHAYGWLTAATACSVTLAQAPAAWLPLYYVREFGLSPGDSALMVGAMFAASVPLGQWTGGYFIDRLRRRGIVAAPNVVLALSLALSILPVTVFCMTHALRLSLVAYTLFSFLAAAATPCGLAGWQALTPARSVGLTISILVSIVTLIGVGLGPLAIGILAGWVLADENALGSAMLILFVTVGIAGCLFALAGRSACQARGAVE